MDKSEQGALNNEITAITDPLLKLNPTATDDMIVASLRRLLDELKPHQAELVRRLAIPRWFDADVLQVLRDDGGDGRAFAIIRSYSFVRPLGDGRYALHEQVRTALLRAWVEQRPDDLRALQRRLADYFRERAALLLRRDIARVVPNPASPTAISIAPTGRWELDEREAIYHALRADPASGMEQLRAAFAQSESAHRLGDAEALLQLPADAPLGDEARQWVRYLRGRVELAALRLNEASAQLEALRDELAPQSASLLSARVSQTLGDVYVESGRWVDAVELYRTTLDYFAANNRPHEAAQVQLRIGAAYQELAANTGGWHVPAYPRNRVLRTVVAVVYTLLALPFYVVTWALRRTPFALPAPRFLAFYQNWLLIWLYRTARGWYERAYAGFVAQNDDAGAREAEQRIAQITMAFGYADVALVQFDQLRGQTTDSYARAWIDRDRAEALLAQGNSGDAVTPLADALTEFQRVGDVRREAAVLALQSRAAVERDDVPAALDGYRTSLARFRALRFAAAREQVLHDLRAWRRRVGSGDVFDQISALLVAEPEKRYVARFVRSQLAWLQVLSVVAFPLTLLLLAIFAPTIRTEFVQSLVRQSLYFSPWRALTVLAVLFVLYIAVYALVALVVIFVAPFDALDHEQPDYLMTDDHGIARYDYRGKPVQRLRWADVHRWVGYDRRLWELPHPLFSSTYLEDSSGQRLKIDGITAWYTSLQDDIERHLAATNNGVPREDLGYTVIGSKTGAAVALGLLLILVFASAENNWLRALIVLLPPWLYAALWLLAFSNALILFPFNYWFAIRPLALRRTLDIRDWWPAIVGLVGIVALALGQGYREGMLLSGIPALAVGLTVWGAHIIAEAVATRFFPRSRAARSLIIVVSVLGAAATVLPVASTLYLATVSRIGERRAEVLRAPQLFIPLTTAQREATESAQQSLAAARILVAQPDITPEQKARAYAVAGRAYASTGDYDAAIQSYDLALLIYDQLGENLSVQHRETLASLHYNRGQALRAKGDTSSWQQELWTACELYPQVDAGCRSR